METTHFDLSLKVCGDCDIEADMYLKAKDKNELKLTQFTVNDLKSEVEITTIKSKSCSCPCGACGAPFEDVTWNID